MGQYTDKKVIVCGLGISGRAAAMFLLASGAFVHGIDRDATTLDCHEDVLSLKRMGMTTGLESSVKTPLDCDFVVISPGVPSSHPVINAAKVAGIEVIGEIELACREIKNPVLGVTGTNGKTTVTLLVTHVLNQNGFKAKALGNVGIPLCQELLEIDSKTIVVLELSSYQLETLSQPVLDAGVILNITPDHLDRYAGMEDYAKAKFMMQNCLKKGAPLYVEDSAYASFGHHLKEVNPRIYGYSAENEIYSDLKQIFYQNKSLFELPENLKERKSHDIENLMAAFALCHARGITGQQFIEAYHTFKKPSHRIEYVLTMEGVRYYDDSKGTNIDAVIRAVEYLDAPIVLIAGGVDKGSPYTPWIQGFKKKVKSICAIGQAAAKIEAQLSYEIPVSLAKDLDHAVELASTLAREGDIVLLSPGCSSFDMFRDYAHRGEEFQKIVRNISMKALL